MSGASVHITVGLVRLDLDRVGAGVVSDLSGAYAHDISSALGLDEDSLKDLTGEVASTTVATSSVAGSAGAKIDAFTVVPDGSSAQVFASSLYTDEFRSTIVKTTIRVLREHGKESAILGHLHAPMVVVNPEKFHPLKPTTTTRMTEAATTTVTSTTVTTTTQEVQHDLTEATSVETGASTSAAESTAFLSTTPAGEEDKVNSAARGKIPGMDQVMLALLTGVMSHLLV